MEKFDASPAFRVLRTPRSRATRTITPTLKSLRTGITESWAQRPQPAGLPRKRSLSRQSSASTRTRTASLEKLQTGSISKDSISRVGTKYQVENEAGNEKKGRRK